MARYIKTGTFTQAATAVAKSVTIGFTPDYVKIWNLTDGDYLEWIKGMTTGKGMLVLAGTANTLKAGQATANGITPMGSDAGDTFKGFTLGLNANFNIAAKVYHWVAAIED